MDFGEIHLCKERLAMWGVFRGRNTELKILEKKIQSGWVYNDCDIWKKKDR